MFEAKAKQLTLAPQKGTELAQRWPTIKEGYEIAGPYKLYRAWRRLTLPFRAMWCILRGRESFRLIYNNGEYTGRMKHGDTSSMQRAYLKDYKVHPNGRRIYDPRCRHHKWVPVGHVYRHLNPPSNQARCLKCGEVTSIEH